MQDSRSRGETFVDRGLCGINAGYRTGFLSLQWHVLEGIKDKDAETPDG